MCKVLFLSAAPGATLEPAYGEFLTAVRGRYPVELYDPSRAPAEQFEGVGVVVDLGGWAPHGLIDAGRVAGVKLWQVLGYGLDHLDVVYALENELLLAHTPGQCTAIALAEHALFLMLCVEKNLHQGQRNIRSGVFFQPISGELFEKTLGVIGLGASGRELARRASALGMRITALDVMEIPDEMRAELHVELFYRPQGLEQFLGGADYISIHAPLTSSTRIMITERAFRCMKPSAVLINVARGAIVDEVALIETLTNRRIRGRGWMFSRMSR